MPMAQCVLVASEIETVKQQQQKTKLKGVLSAPC